MKREVKRRCPVLLAVFAMLLLVAACGRVSAEELKDGYDETGAVYYVVEDDARVKAEGIVKVGQEYLYFEKGVLQTEVNGLKQISDDESFELYYLEQGKAVLSTWKTVKEKKGSFRYYFGKDGRAYKADSFAGMRTTKVVVKKVAGVKYGFDENGHMAKGLWSTDSKLVYFHKKTGVYNAKASKKYQKAVKRGKKSVNIPKELKKTLGKPKKIKSTASCNPFDLDADSTIDSDTLNRYKGYNYIYKNIVVSLTQNKKTGVYYVDGAGPIDLD